MTFNIKVPLDCTASELDAFEALVREGGEVVAAGLRERMLSAHYLMFLYDDARVLAGISALKRVHPGYRAVIFHNAKASVRPEDYEAEMGWTYLRQSHRGRGLSAILNVQLLPYAGRMLVYATVRADNTPALRSLVGHGFRQEGVPYRSMRGDYDLVLFVQSAR